MNTKKDFLAKRNVLIVQVSKMYNLSADSPKCLHREAHSNLRSTVKQPYSIADYSLRSAYGANQHYRGIANSEK